jgi:ParB/RepB/Spo0J family partition protein
MKIGELIISKCNARSVVDGDAEDITSLSISIKKHKLISKLILRKNSDGIFEVVAGQRRLKALKESFGNDHELPEDEFVVIEADEEEAYLISLDENINRVNLSPIDLNRAYLRLNSIGKKDKEISDILHVTPHRLKRLATLSADMGRIPENAREELSKPAGESKFNDLHWEKISSSTDDPDIIKDTVDFILEHDTPPREVPSILKAVEKNYKQENIDPDSTGGSGGHAALDDEPVNITPTADSPIEYTHKGELRLEKHGDVETLKVFGKEEDQEVPIEHYLEYLRHPEKFKCYVTFKLKVVPVD